MKKISLALLTSTLSILSAPAQSSLLNDEGLLGLIQGSVAMSNNSINRTTLTNPYSPGMPAPGVSFESSGFGVFGRSLNGMQLSYSFNLSGVYTNYDPEQGKLFFKYTSGVPGVSNQLKLYVDDNSIATEGDSSSYIDGYQVATADLAVDGDATNYIQPLEGRGIGLASFEMRESDRERYGLIDTTIFLKKITSDLLLADFTSGTPQKFNFGAFDGTCMSLNNSCSRESGRSVVVMSSVPVPASLGLFLSGFGLLGWLQKRK